MNSNVRMDFNLPAFSGCDHDPAADHGHMVQQRREPQLPITLIASRTRSNPVGPFPPAKDHVRVGLLHVRLHPRPFVPTFSQAVPRNFPACLPRGTGPFDSSFNGRRNKHVQTTLF